jgi:hypothetical protein
VPRDNCLHGYKTICVDDSNTHHIIIGLNRENVESILRGDVFTLPSGAAPLGADSDIVVIFGETDEELVKRFPPVLRPVDAICILPSAPTRYLMRYRHAASNRRRSRENIYAEAMIRNGEE